MTMRRIHTDVCCDDDTHTRTIAVDQWVSEGNPPAFIYLDEPTTPNDTGLVVLNHHDEDNIDLITQCYDCATAWPDFAGPLRYAARYGMWIAPR